MNIDLKKLVGKHYLTGVEMNSIEVKDSYDPEDKTGQTISFILDKITYTAIEDPEDGYRSCMRELVVNKYKVKNKFKRVEVVCIIKDDILEIYDVNTGKLLLEIGTDHGDDYYPTFVGNWRPENLCLNINSI